MVYVTLDGTFQTLLRLLTRDILGYPSFSFACIFKFMSLYMHLKN